MSSSLKKSSETRKYSWTETGTAIFAFLNVIAASICVLICFNILIMYIWEALTHTDVIDTFMWSMCLSVNFGVFVVLIFAIVLFIGVNRRKPCYMLAYIIFGVFVVIAIICGLVALYYKNQDTKMDGKIRELFHFFYNPLMKTMIGICAVYALLLTMVCRTWFVMTFRRSEDHEKLVNDYYEQDWSAD